MKIYDMHIHSFNRPADARKLLSEMEMAGVYGGCVFSNWPEEANAAFGTPFEDRLSEEILLGRIRNGEKVTVDYNGTEFVFISR